MSDRQSPLHLPGLPPAGEHGPPAQAMSLMACVALATVLHLLTALAGIYVSRQAGSIATVWLPNAIAVVILLSRVRREWPVILLGVAVAGVVSNLVLGSPPLRCAAFALADVCEITIASELLRRYCRIEDALDSVGMLLRVELLGGIVPAVFGATISAPLLIMTGKADVVRLWFTWFEASAIGAVSVLPLGILIAVRGWAAVRDALREPRLLLSVLVCLCLTLWAVPSLPRPYVYVGFGLVVVSLVGRFPGAALAVLLTSVAMLVPITSPVYGTAVPADPYARAWLVVPVALTLVLPMLLAVTLERIQEDILTLAEREGAARQLYRKTPVMMYTVDRDRHVLEVSDAWLERMGYQREDVVGRSTDDFLTPDSRRVAAERVIPEFRRSGEIRDIEYQMVTASGEIVDMLVSAIAERNPAGQFTRAMAVFQDVTEQKRLAAALAREQERTAVTLHCIGDGVVTTDELGRISYLNPVAETLLGWSLGEAKGCPFQTVVHLFDQASGAQLLDPVAECLRDVRAVGLPLSAVMRDRHGREYAVEDSVAPILAADGALLGTVMVFQDVTEQRDLARRMSHLALHDPLTDLPNRVLFQDRVQQQCQFARREGSRFAVMFMDLDHFKRVNDSLGHAIGDELLSTVARRLTRTLRASDTVSRLGGDEFVILVADIEGPAPAAEVARKILTDLAESCMLEGTDIRVSVSLGISMFPDDGSDPDTLMKRADAAMYRSKREGRGRFAFYSKDMDEPATARLQLEADMRHGIAAGEFVVHFQPVVSASNRAAVGVEALARWQRGALGLADPDSFIPVAEESGLIIPMGASILLQACEQLSAWSGTLLSHLRVAVNVSRVQLADPGFVAMVAETLRRTGAPGSQLEIEITESALMTDPERALQVLSLLKQLGVRIAIDDFGTGYSSLSSLKQFPVDTVKIDRSFMTDLETDADDRELVNAILAMSRSLRLDVVAEGVERDSQASILASMKCPSLQGFLFSSPADSERTTAWLSRRDLASRQGEAVQSSLFS